VIIDLSYNASVFGGVRSNGLPRGPKQSEHPIM
jgi:hypothetical protein